LKAKPNYFKKIRPREKQGLSLPGSDAKVCQKETPQRKARPKPPRNRSQIILKNKQGPEKSRSCIEAKPKCVKKKQEPEKNKA
jgi:hypothetical protein